MALIPIYVLGVFVSDVFAPSHEETVINDRALTLTFVGDMMFDRYIRERANTHGYSVILSDVVPFLRLSDITIGNLEGPVTTFASVAKWRESVSNHYKFTFATTVASALADAGFDAVFVGNNHILNFGTEGVRQTKKWLAQNGIAYFGIPDELYVPLRFASTTPTVTMYAFDTWYARDMDKLVEKIRLEPDDTFVVVYAHWGDEYEKEPNAGQRDLAHRFIDAGADFVVGSHPHVIQTKELYNGKWIYYSLGNFVFDQYFNEEVICGALVQVTLQQDMSYEVVEFFTELARDGTTKMSTCAVSVPEKK